jgi:hypothetical protein
VTHDACLIQQHWTLYGMIVIAIVHLYVRRLSGVKLGAFTTSIVLYDTYETRQTDTVRTSMHRIHHIKDKQTQCMRICDL